MKHQADDRKHFDACHERWIKFANRDINRADHPDAWYETQCLTCAYYIPLVGVFSEDYGVCSNGLSTQDGKVMFEHDGCDQHQESENFWQYPGKQ